MISILRIPRILFGLLFAVQLLGAPLKANSDRRFFPIPEEAELTSASVLCLARDSNGFLWMGTLDGMSRYDGFHCKSYRWKTKDGESVSHVNQIVEDSTGHLWITSHEGLFRFNPAKETFEDIFVRNHPLFKNKGPLLTRVALALDGSLLVTSYDGLIHLDPNTLKYKHYTHDPANPHSIPDAWKRLGCVFPVSKSIVLVGSFEGLLSFDITTEKFSKILPSDLGLEFESWSRIYHIMQARNGTYWLSTRFNGLIAIEPSLKKASDFNQSQFAKELAETSVYGSAEGPTDSIWINTDKGLKQYDPKNQSLISHAHDISNPYTMGDNTLNNHPLIEDDILWIPTRHTGLWNTDLRPSMFSRFTAQNNNGLSHPSVTDFAEDSEGNLFIGTDGGGLNRMNAKDGSFSYFYKGDPPYDIASDKVLAAIIDKKGRYWFGTWNEGVSFYDPSTGTRKLYRPIPDDPNSLNGLSIFRIIEDSKGDIWFASWDNGVAMYDESKDRFIRFPNRPDMIDKEVASPVCTLMQDRDGYIWIGSEVDGINVLNPTTGELKAYRHIPDQPSVKANSVNCFFQTRDGLILVGTNGGGINVFDPKEQTFINHPLMDKITPSSIFGIEEDYQGRIWLSSNRGLIVYDPVSEEMTHYSKNDGLHDNKFSRWVHIKLRNGDLIFGGRFGFTRIHPDISQSERAMPTPFITGIWANDQFLGYEPQSETIRYPTDINKLRFEFSAPWFRGADQLVFQYKLEGVDNDWVELTGLRTVQYPNLQYGEYIFKVRVSNIDGKWNEKTAYYSFKITTPIWAQWYAKILYLILIAAILFGFFKLRVRQYKKHKNELENRIRERTEDLYQSNKELQKTKSEFENQNKRLTQLNQTKDKMMSIFAHDLKNPFNALLGISDLLSQNYDSLSDSKRLYYLGLIRSSSYNIHELLENLLYWSLTQDRNLPYKPIVIEMHEGIVPALTLYEPVAKKKSVVLDYDPETFNQQVIADKELIAMVIRNLLNNALKFTPENSTISITCEKAEDCVIVSVNDSGPGISAEQAKDILRGINKVDETNRKKGTGLGIPICKEIIEMHSGSLYVDLDYKKGASFCFTLPVIILDSVLI